MIATRSGKPSGQHAIELSAFLDFIRAEGVRSYLEIGARYGDTFHAIVSTLPPGSRAVAVDLPGGPWGDPESAAHLSAAVIDLRGRGYRAGLILGRSQSPDVIDSVRVLAPFDLVLIDADHRYDAVRDDVGAYGTVARMVALHDVVGWGQRDPAGRPVEVPRLWQEMQQQYRIREFIAPRSRMGIGVAWMA